MAKTVLLIEDNQIEAKMFADLIESNSISAVCVYTGKDGISKALEIKPDLILLDLILPDISGFEVCKKLKEAPELEKTLIVALSVKDSLIDINRAFDMGADDYIIKPSNLEHLIRKIKLYLGVR